MNRISLLNFEVDVISFDETVYKLFDNIDKKIKSFVFFINALKVYELDKNAELKNAMSSFNFLLADGVPIVWISKLFKKPLPGRVNGTDLFEKLMENAEKRNKSVYFLGATQENIEKLIEVIRYKHPRLNIAGFRNGYFNQEEECEVVEVINQSEADILFLGFGSPKKELWAYKHKDQLTVPVVQGVGGSFDIVAGIIQRAPKWMQKSGLEWLYRVIKEPNRMFKRYFVSNTVFLYLVIKYFIKDLFRNNSKSHLQPLK